jgi:hypothetical protein
VRARDSCKARNYGVSKLVIRLLEGRGRKYRAGKDAARVDALRLMDAKSLRPGQKMLLAAFLTLQVRDKSSWMIRNSGWRHFGRQSRSAGNPLPTTGRRVENSWFLKPFTPRFTPSFNIFKRPLSIQQFKND